MNLGKCFPSALSPIDRFSITQKDGVGSHTDKRTCLKMFFHINWLYKSKKHECIMRFETQQILIGYQGITDKRIVNG